MKKFLALALAALASLIAAPALAAGATGPDYSTLTAAVDFGTTITAILAIGALAVGIALVVVGIKKILRMIRTA